MKTIYRNLFTAALMAVGCSAAAQTINSAYFTEDYKFRHMLNPAFGNEQNYVSIPALGNISVNTHGNFGYQDVIMSNPMYPSLSSKKMTTFMNPYISAEDALSGFSTGKNRITGDVSLTILSAGFKAFGGYNTIEINSRTTTGVSLPYELFEFAKNTGNHSYDIGDINAHAQSFAEIAFGHSRQINDKLRLGAKLKVLVGLGRADVKMRNMKADLTAEDKWTITGEATADVSMKGFSYVSEEKKYNIEGSGTYERVNDVDLDGVGVGGFGMAIDLGGVYEINEDWTVSASVLDLGFISWANDMLAENRSKSFVFNGFHDVSVTSDRGEEIDTKVDRYGDQLADFANLTDMGDKGGRSTGIGATINVGAEYTLPVYRKVSFGALCTSRINGAYSWTEGRLSANYAPLNWLDGGVSFAVNSFTTSMGWVLNLHPKGYNFFIGMDHILGKTSKEMIPLSSNASLTVGMNITW
mgnify:FL=1